MAYWIVVLIILVLLCALRIAIDSFSFKVEEITIPLPADESNELDAIHPSNVPYSTQKPLRLLFLSDLHLRDCLISQARIVAAIRDKPCDLILFGGDLDREVWSEALSWLQELQKNLAEAWDKPDLPPVLGVWGNHDGIVPRSEGRRPGLHFLENEAFHYRDNEVLWEILGLGDLKTSELDPKTALAHGRESSGGPVDPQHRLILVHNPDAVFHNLPDSRLILAGHYHDGQIRLPWRLEFKLLRRDDRLANRGIISGLHHYEGRSILISPGIGNTFIPIRFFSQAGLHIINIESGEKDDR